ncbi:MAG: DUF262 domain-containing protein [Pseudomonadota bacterium]
MAIELDTEDGVEDDTTQDMKNPFDPKDIDIVVEPKSLDILIERVKHGGIDMNTEFQRHADLWDNQKKSRLIESILIRFPLPAFYFDASDDDNWLIVDGLQRLSAIRSFVIKKNLGLSGLEFMTDLKGKRYDDISSTFRRRVRECPVTVYLIKARTPVEVKYSVFQRINTGGLTLNKQEIRNAMAKKADRKLLQEISEHNLMRKLMGDLSKRMMDQELVLRFWAFFYLDYFNKKYSKTFSTFLDHAMEQFKKTNHDEREKFKSVFEQALSRCDQLFGETAFQKTKEKKGMRYKNRSLFEVWMVSLAKLNQAGFNKLLQHKERVTAALHELLQDSEFYKSISHSTQKSDHVRTRYAKVDTLIKRFTHA